MATDQKTDSDRQVPGRVHLLDDQLEHQLRDRLSFIRYPGLGPEDSVPDAEMIWLYREQLAKARVIEEQFDNFDGLLRERGYLAMGGQIIDAPILPVLRQDSSQNNNTKIKAGEIPEDWTCQAP